MTDFIAQQGWQCPICKRVYSPSTPCCFTCGNDDTTTTSTNGSITQNVIKFVAYEDGRIEPILSKEKSTTALHTDGFITKEDYVYNKKKHRWGPKKEVDE